MRETLDQVINVVILLFVAITIMVPFVAHIVVTVKLNWAAMLIIGLVIPPVGWVHGMGILLGVW